MNEKLQQIPSILICGPQ